MVFHSGYKVKGKNPFTRSLKSEYQPCGYVLVQASDAGKSARTEPERKQPFHDRTAVCAFGSRAIPFVRKEAGSAFSPRPWTGYYDTHYRLPTRQMGWPTLGCNQQDPWRASERLVNCKPARMVPKVAGGRAANTAQQKQTEFRLSPAEGRRGLCCAAPFGLVDAKEIVPT